MSFAGIAIGLGIADVDGAAEGNGGAALMMLTGSLILMQVDGTLNRNKLVDELREVATGPMPVRPQLASIGPWVSPDRGGGLSAGVGLSGSW